MFASETLSQINTYQKNMKHFFLPKYVGKDC